MCHLKIFDNFKLMKSLFDFIFALSLFIFILPLFFILCFFVKLSSRGPIFHWSKRIGQNNIIFYMPKFRSMNINTPHVATDLLTNPHLHVTTIGSFLRKTSLDELPQLFCIINGSMSFVGPRPALYNQKKLIMKRSSLGIDKLKPGITGFAQINGRDLLTDDEKIRLDFEYLKCQSFWFDIKILILTFFKIFHINEIVH